MQVFIIILTILMVLLLLLFLMILKPPSKKPDIDYALDFNTDKLIEALGGPDNIKEVEAVGSRLKVILLDNSVVDYKKIKSLGATSIIEKSDSFNFIFGKASTSIKALLDQKIK